MIVIQESRMDILELKKSIMKMNSARAAAIKSFDAYMKAKEELYRFMKRKKDDQIQVLQDHHVRIQRQRIYGDIESDDSQ